METEVEQSGTLRWKLSGPRWTKAEHELGTSGALKRNELETGVDQSGALKLKPKRKQVETELDTKWSLNGIPVETQVETEVETETGPRKQILKAQSDY